MKIIAFAFLGLMALSACSTGGNFTSSTSDGRNRVMDITNNTGVTMTRFFASNTNQSSWGPDQLGTTVMESGMGRRMDFDDGTGACLFDFKAVFADGDVLTSRDINVCVESSWTYQ
jgi:hypothetical protein